MKAKIGDRVGAIKSAGNGAVSFFGYGVYVGETIPPADVAGFNIGLPTPTINLDDGGVVYGCECWWGAEAKVKEMISDLAVVRAELERGE